MTRLNYVKKARKPIPSAGIEKGDSYYWWQFAFRSKQVSKTRPRRSQYMTQSPYLSQIYDIEDDLGALTVEQIEEGCLDEFISQIESVKDEAESSLGNIPDQLKDAPAGATLQEYIDNCEQWISDLEDVDFSELDESSIREEAKQKYSENLESCKAATLENPAKEPKETEEEIFNRLMEEKKDEILMDIQSKMYPG